MPARLVWWLCHGGWSVPAVAVVLLLLAGLGLQLAVLAPMRLRIEAAHQELLDARQRQRSAADQQAAPEVRRARLLERFEAQFSGRPALPGLLARLHDAAAAEGLLLRQGEYKLLPPDGARLQRYQVQLPVTGPYPGIRAFVAGVLEQLPEAALDQIALERRKIGDSQVEAQLRFTFYVATP